MAYAAESVEQVATSTAVAAKASSSATDITEAPATNASESNIDSKADPATAVSVVEPTLPNVDHLLGEDPSTAPTPGLSGAVTTTEVSETAMAAPPKRPPATAKAAPPAKALPPMTQVKLNYKQGKYLDGLKVLATIKPTEITHYYAGLCYQGQGQLQKAAAEFGYVASIAKDPLIRYNAQSALQAVSSYARSRTYSGQGNAFARASSGGGGGGGGGGGSRRRS